MFFPEYGPYIYLLLPAVLQRNVEPNTHAMDTEHTLTLAGPPMLEGILSEPARKSARQEELQEKILRLKKEKNAIILAHYYQRPEIQDIADYVGDSLGLSRMASDLEQELIVFAGVYFMAETAKVLNPDKKVLIPEPESSCSLANSCPPEAFRKFVEAHPDHLVVTYINTSAEIKALSDYVCTSTNALEIIQSLPEERPVIFAPDRNLGNYIRQFTGRDILLWNGGCHVHESFSISKLVQLYRQHPQAWVIAHPECEEEILRIAHFIGSTAGLIDFARRYPRDTFIVATEVGIIHQMKKAVPEARLIPAPTAGGCGCNYAECAHMKLNTLEKLYHCLRLESPEVRLPRHIMERAAVPIRRMLDLSGRLNARG